MIDGAEHHGRIVRLHESAGSVVDGLARDGGVIGVHHAMDETEEHPLCDQLRLPSDHAVQQRSVRPLRSSGLRIVPRDRIVRQRTHSVCVAPRSEILKGAHAQMARRHPGQHGPRQDVFAQTCSPVVTAARARVVGTPSAAMASLTMYSRKTGPSAALPSPRREKGVGPEPLSWMS